VGPPASHGVPRAPCYSGTRTRESNVSHTGLSPSVVGLSRPFCYVGFCNLHVSGPATPDRSLVWADSFSLAATGEVDVSFFSSGYLDVSVPRVAFDGLYIQPPIIWDLAIWGFPIRISRDRRLFDSFSELFAAYHVLHRLLAPRHPPYTLSNLTTIVLASVRTRLQPGPSGNSGWVLITYRYSKSESPDGDSNTVRTFFATRFAIELSKISNFRA
jgi:hypothetical protein